MKTSIRGLALMAALTLASGAVSAHDPIPVHFTTADGVQIVGDYWTPIGRVEKAPVVIHGSLLP